MKLNSAQTEQTLAQLDGEAIPKEHPMLAQLERMFGDHTFILDAKGLDWLIEQLASLCHEKAEHLRSAWQDAPSAKAWTRDAQKLERLARRVEH